MARNVWYRVTVTDDRGRVVIDWTASLLSSIRVNTQGGKTVITRRSLFGSQTYIPSMNESVKMRGWVSNLMTGQR